MRIFEILAGDHKGKKIHVTKYKIEGLGVSIKIEHDVPTVAGKQIQWVQTVSSNAAVTKSCKMLVRVDPFGDWDPSIHKFSLPAVPGLCKADDLLPFYWTADDLAGGSGPGLSDSPSDPAAPASGRIWNNFITGLTEVTDKKVHHLVTISWGYDVMADSEVRVAAILRATTAQMDRHTRALKTMYPDYTYT